MPIPLFTVDAFTDRPFAGNPAAVCILQRAKDDRWLKGVAGEMNLPETAYIRRLDGQRYEFELRWFTPLIEVDLCGHATLATAHVLWSQGIVPPGQAITFHSRSGPLLVVQTGGAIELDFPLVPESESPAPPGLLESLGTTARYVGRNRFDYLVEVPSEQIVRRLAPDLAALARVEARGVMVTARSDTPEFDFVSRYFAPQAGIPEDHATGSAHCSLVDYWRKQTGRSEFVAYQASPRGAVIRVRAAGDRAILGGKAVLVSRGELFVD